MKRTGHSLTAPAVIALAALLALPALLGGCIQITIPSGGSAGPPAAKAGSKPSASSTNVPAMPGADQSAGSWQVKVMSAKRTKKGPGGAKPGPGKDWLLVDVEFRNIKMADALRLDPADVTLTNSTGKTVPTSATSMGYNGAGMRDISPGYGGGTIFAYKIPAGSAGYVWTFAPKVDGKRRSLSWGVP